MILGALVTPRVRVAITGHRLNQLSEAARETLGARIGEALDLISAAAQDAAIDRERLTLLSPLAEGADRYAAHAALARGWRLEALIPFGVARYLKDFAAEDSKKEFRDLMGQASRRRALEGEQAERANGGAAPYAELGKVIARQAAIVIAVWNGQPPAGPGGTAEVAAGALQHGAPVIWVHGQDDRPAALILPTVKRPRAHSSRGRLHRALTTRFPLTSQPVEMRFAES